MKGKWEVFPYELLERLPDGRLGFSYVALVNNAKVWELYNAYWDRFEADSQWAYYTLKEDPVMDKEKREV